LKKNKVAIDIVNFGHSDNAEKLKGLVDAANNANNCHFLDVPLGVAMITDLLISSPILAPDNGADMGDVGAGAGSGPAAGAPAGGQFAEFGGIDPSLDPELAMALRISLEEER
jgi:26S proteasome regulatory subunit N10